TRAEVDLPFWGKVEINGREELVLLLGNWIEIRGRADGAVILEAGGDFLGEVVADLDVGRKDQALALREAVDGLVKSRVERQIPRADLLINDRAHFPSPGVHGKPAALVAEFVGEAEAGWPVPFGRDANAGADVIAKPIDAQPVFLRGEDIKAGF